MTVYIAILLDYDKHEVLGAYTSQNGARAAIADKFAFNDYWDYACIYPREIDAEPLLFDSLGSIVVSRKK